MRIIVYGVGAVGGTIAAALAHAGNEVLGIARGRQLEAIQSRGLTLRAPRKTLRVRLECVSDPGELDPRPDDSVLLTMKSQDTEGALDALARAGFRDQPIFCAQNGVANERMAAGHFPNVHGITVMLPARILAPGKVASFMHPRLGMFDIGRYPEGDDSADRSMADVLERAGFAAFVMPDVMASKYGKLLMNLGNVVQAATGPKSDNARLLARVRKEAEAVYEAAGITWRDVGREDPRRAALASFRKPWFTPYVGGSTTQSLLRGTGSVETSFLNGEIAEIARRAGLEAPLNAGLADLGGDLARDAARPGDMSPEDVEDYLARR